MSIDKDTYVTKNWLYPLMSDFGNGNEIRPLRPVSVPDYVDVYRLLWLRKRTYITCDGGLGD